MLIGWAIPVERPTELEGTTVPPIVVEVGRILTDKPLGCWTLLKPERLVTLLGLVGLAEPLAMYGVRRSGSPCFICRSK